MIKLRLDKSKEANDDDNSESEANGISDDNEISSSSQSSVDDDDDDDDASIPSESGSNIQAKLAAAGPTGVAAAAAIATARKRKRPLTFETNPSIRKRQQTRLIRKLRTSIDEYTMRVGQQAIVLIAMPGKMQNNFKVFGAQPLENVIRSCKHEIMNELENSLLEQAPQKTKIESGKHELPPLVIDGIPTPVEKMTQAQLRAFIPMMLKYSTGRGKPGWGKDSTRPPWWPETLPWANVRSDARGDSDKHKISWTTTLRQIVTNCYKYHGRDDLLPTFKENEEATKDQEDKGRKVLPNFRFISTSNGRVKSSEATANNNSASLIDDEQNGHHIYATTTPGYGANFLQTINNVDGTVSLIQVDPSHSQILTLPDGTQVRAVRLQAIDADGLCVQAIDGNLAAGTQSLGEGQHAIALPENSLTVDGQIILTSEDGIQSAYPMSNLVSFPSNIYDQLAQENQEVTLMSTNGSTITANALNVQVMIDGNQQDNSIASKKINENHLKSPDGQTQTETEESNQNVSTKSHNIDQIIEENSTLDTSSSNGDDDDDGHNTHSKSNSLKLEAS